MLVHIKAHYPQPCFRTNTLPTLFFQAMEGFSVPGLESFRNLGLGSLGVLGLASLGVLGLPGLAAPGLVRLKVPGLTGLLVDAGLSTSTVWKRGWDNQGTLGSTPESSPLTTAFLYEVLLRPLLSDPGLSLSPSAASAWFPPVEK